MNAVEVPHEGAMCDLMWSDPEAGYSPIWPDMGPQHPVDWNELVASGRSCEMLRLSDAPTGP